MAKQLNVNLAFTADVGRAKAQLQDLQNQLTKVINTPTAGLGAEMKKSINEASYAAAELKVHLQQAMNPQTGSLDFSKLNQSLQKSNISLSAYAEKIRSIGPEGQRAFMQLAQSVASAEVPIRRSNVLISQLWTAMKNTARWQLSSSVLHGFVGALQSAVSYSKDLNESLNNIRIVSGKSVDEMAEFAQYANKAAKALSATTTEYTNASLIYYQQGLDDEEIRERTEATIKMANVTSQTAEVVSDQMTAVWNNFDDGSKSLEYYADVMTALGAATASSTDEIAEGLEKFAAVAETVGLSYEYATSALATVTATTRQSADVVGTAFKTLFARIQGLNLGETLDDGTTLNKYSEALSKVGISIFEQNGEMKDMNNILDEMGNKWNKLSKDQQVALAQTVAGVRQYTQLVALMDNWDYFQENLQVANNSSGTLNEQQKIYEESWKAASDRVSAAIEGITETLADDDMFIGFLNTTEKIVSTFDKLIDRVGGLKGTFSLLGVVITKVFSKQLTEGVQNLSYNMKNMKDGGASVRAEKSQQISNMLHIMDDDDEVQTQVDKTASTVLKAQLESQQRLIESAKTLTETEEATLQVLLEQQKVRGDQAIKAAEEEQAARQRMSDSSALLIGHSGIKTDDLQKYRELSKKIGLQRSSMRVTDDGDANQDDAAALQQLIKERDTLEKSMIKGAQLSKSEAQQLKNYGAAAEDVASTEQKRIALEQEASRELDLNTQKERENAAATTQEGNAKEEAAGDVEKHRQKLDEESGALDRNKKKMKMSAEGYVNSAMAALQLVSAVSMIGSAIDTIKDPDLDFTEKFSQAATSLSMSIPMLWMGLQNFNKVLLASGAATTAAAAGTSKFAGVIVKLIPALGGVAVAIPYLIAAAAAIAVVAYILDTLIVTEKEARENIEKANEAFSEQKQTLEDLNSSLKTTQDRIDELNKQDTLTVIEEEELAKLKQEQAYLERQIALQKKLTDAAQKTQATTIKENYSKANSTLTAGPQTGRYMGLIDDNGSYVYESADEWFARVTQGLDETSDAYAQFEQSYKDWVAENEQTTLDWLNENAAAIQQAETDYQSYAQAIADGSIEYNAEDAAAMQNTLSSVRKNVYSDAEYEETFLKPILTNSAAMRQADDSIYHAIAIGSDASGLINSYLQEDLLMAGVSVDEFLNYLTEDINKASENMKNLGVETSEIEELTAEDWQVITELNFENIETADELWDALENYKNSKINVEVVGIDTLQTVLDKLNEEQKPMEDALSSYKDNGYLTMDEVQELIAANSEYAKYIVKVGDSYKLATQALTDFRDSEAKEAQALDEMIGLMGQAGQVNKDYVTNYTNAWDDLIAKSAEYQEGQYSFSGADDAKLFNERTQALKENSIAYQEGKITTDQYFNNINTRLSQLNAGFHNLDDEIEGNVEQTDLYEATMVAATGSIADGLADLSSQFKSGQVNMDEYYKGTIAGTKALITAHSKTNKNIKKNSDGVWELKEGIDQTTLSSEDYAKAVSDIEQLNAWEKQVSQAEDMQDTVDILTDNYDYLLQYADAFGAVDFTIDNNFDTTAQQFQDLCTSMGEELIDLEANNKASYQRVLQGILDQGIQLANGLDTSASELQAAMAQDAALASAVVNSSMLESSGTISSVSQAAGNVLSALGDLISNFDYTLSFKPVVVDKGGVHIQEWLEGEEDLPFSLPKLGINITGSGGDSVNSFVSALQDAAGYLNTQGSGTGQGGIFDYGKEPEDWTPLNPDEIETDNIRDDGDGYKPEIERYHEINRQIEDQEKLLNKIATAKENAYGISKINLMEQEIAEMDKMKSKQNELLAEQQKYLEQDKKALLKLFPSAEFDENGNISNYNELLMQTTSEEQKAILDQYEETVDAIQETEQALIDLENQIKSMNFEKMSYKLELELDLNDAELQEIEFELNLIADDFYKMAEAAGFMIDQINPLNDSLSDLRNHFVELQDARASDKISQADYIDGLKETRDSIYDQLNALVDLDKEMMEYYGNTLDAAMEELDKYTDHMEHLTGVIDHYISLMELMGKSTDFEAMDEFLSARAETTKNELDVAKSNYEMLARQKALIEERMAGTREGSADWKLYKNEWDKIVAQMDEAQDEMLSKTEEWMEAMKAVIENNMNKAAKSLEDALTNGISFDHMMTELDRLNERQEEYLTKTNQVYETNKLMRQAAQATDKTDNAVAKQKFKNFAEETKQLQEKGQLSKYELEIQQAKYDLLLAEIALEDAQNAKSTVRLQRDSEGNFGYVYTADQDKISDAQQAVEDAENDLYNISLNGQQEYTEKYTQALQNMYDEMKALQEAYLAGDIATEQEYQARKEALMQHYFGVPDGILTTYSNLYNVAVQTDADATADFWAKSYGDMTANTEAFKDAVNGYLVEVETETEVWHEITKTAQEDITEGLDDLVDESEEYADVVDDEVIPALEDELDAVEDLTAGYADQRDEVLRLIQTYKQLVQAINAAIAAAARQSGSSRSSSGDLSRDAAIAVTKGEDTSEILSDRAEEMETGNHPNAVDQDVLERIIEAAQNNDEDALKIIDGVVNDGKKYTDYNLDKWSYGTGGYTGEWGPQAKLAFVHEKEIMLNPDDTVNFLSAIQITRSIMELIDKQAGCASAGLGVMSASGVQDYSQVLEQEVTIHAEFPNATNHNEIEEAFHNLMNTASQYAHRKNR